MGDPFLCQQVNALLPVWMWVTWSPPMYIPASPLGCQPSLSVPTSSIFPRPEQTGPHSAFCPQARMRNERPFCPLLYKAICVGQLPPTPGGAGRLGVGQEARQTQPHSPRLVNRQQLHSGRRQGSGWNPWPQGLLKRKRSCCWWAVPRGSQSSLCPPTPCVSPAPLLCPAS